MARLAPPEFVAELVRRFGAGHDARFNDLTQRWEVITPSASGTPVSQVWGWFYTVDPHTGARTPIPARPDGLPPFRDLDTPAQLEILENMERSFVGNRHDGAASPTARLHKISAENTAKKERARKARATTYAELIGEVAMPGRWKLDHLRNTGPRLYSLPSQR